MSNQQQTPGGDTSYERTRNRFNTSEAAAVYPTQYGRSLRDRRERRCILKVLKHVPPGSHILDLPCGAGRLTRIQVGAGFRVTGADSSESMVEQARQNYERIRSTLPGDSEPVNFEVQDVMRTRYRDGQFDAVFCNRLFHHFTEPDTRVAALKELARICRGPVIVSYFDSFALDAVRFKLKHWLRRTRPIDRIPIPFRTLLDDIRRAGLQVRAATSVIWGVSPMRYVVVEAANGTARAQAAHAGTGLDRAAA